MKQIERGLYTAASGMLAGQFVQDALAGSLANLGTAGYKQDVPTFRSFQEMALTRRRAGAGPGIGTLNTGTAFDRSYTDFSPGPIMQTRRELDFALEGSGFFSIQTPRGERYTRSGVFVARPNKDGTRTLSDAVGNPVLGSKGPITLPGSGAIAVDAKGSVSVNGQLVDQLKLVDAGADQATKEGGSLFRIDGRLKGATAQVRQGALEQPNVDPVAALVRMIGVQRAYESAQKVAIAQDEALAKATTEVGRTS